MTNGKFETIGKCEMVRLISFLRAQGFLKCYLAKEIEQAGFAEKKALEKHFNVTGRFGTTHNSVKSRIRHHLYVLLAIFDFKTNQ